MEYLKYSLYPSKEEALINIKIIELNMKYDGYLNDNEKFDEPTQVGLLSGKKTIKAFFKNPLPKYMKGTSFGEQTNENPVYKQLINYKIYNYLNDSAKEKYKDPSTIPHAIDYIIDVSPRFYAERVFNKGFITNTTWYTDSTKNEELLKVWMDWETYEDSPMESAKTIKSRKTYRQWITDDNTYLPVSADTKITTKYYDTILLQRAEGRRRRDNIFTLLSKDFITLIALSQTSGNTTQAEQIGFTFISKYNKDVSDYKEVGSLMVIQDVLTDNSPEFNDMLNFIVPDIPPFNVLVPESVNYSIRDYLILKMQGLL